MLNPVPSGRMEGGACGHSMMQLIAIAVASLVDSVCYLMYQALIHSVLLDNEIILHR